MSCGPRRDERSREIRVTSYILGELLPQFFSTFVIFCSVLIISQLVRLSEMLVAFGLSWENLLLPFLFVMLPFVSYMIPMAMLFAVVIAFSRMSADGEYTALVAAGHSLLRTSGPVVVVALLLYGLGALCASHFEAWGRRELEAFIYRKTQTEVDNLVRHKLQPGIFLDDFLGYVLYAEEVSDDKTKLGHVILAPGSTLSRKQDFTLVADAGRITGSVETGDLTLSLMRGTGVAVNPTDRTTGTLNFDQADIDLIRLFKDQIFTTDAATLDYRSYRPMRLWRYISDLADDPQRDEKLYRKASFLFHWRLATPFAALPLALIGMVLGISDQRRPKSWGYLGAVLAVIGAYVLAMGFKWLGENGLLATWIAAWTPQVLLLALGGFMVYQRNRLPLSENIFSPAHLPGRRAAS